MLKSLWPCLTLDQSYCMKIRGTYGPGSPQIIMSGKHLLYRRADGRTDNSKTICSLFYKGGGHKNHVRCYLSFSLCSINELEKSHITCKNCFLHIWRFKFMYLHLQWHKFDIHGLQSNVRTSCKWRCILIILQYSLYSYCNIPNDILSAIAVK